VLTCPLCKQQFKKIDRQHLIKRHGLSREQYLSQFPAGPIGASPETKLKNGIATSARGPRSKETKEKISKSLKIAAPTRTAAQREASRRNAAIAGKSNAGRKRDSTEQHRRNLSLALKRYYSENPKEPYRGTERHDAQLSHLRKIGDIRRQAHWEDLQNNFPKRVSAWASSARVLLSGQKIFGEVTCNACSTNIVRQLRTYQKHQWGSTICHTCNPPLAGTSKAEEELNEFFILSGVVFQRHVRGLLPHNWELDFYNAEKKLAIEYHGLYWHSSAMDYPRDKHRKKYEWCRDNGIQLIQIFEDEWSQKRAIVKNRLLSILKLSKSAVAARNCTIKAISFGAARLFLDEHHLQGGAVASKHRLGLFDGEKLVAVMTLGQPRAPMNQKKEPGALELVRFATMDSIPGAFSKLFKHAVRTLNPVTVYSWADLRWTNPVSNVYLTNGFLPCAESEVGYSYTDLVSRYHRFGCRKPRGCPKTELEWNAAEGRYAVHDAGTINYVWRAQSAEIL